MSKGITKETSKDLKQNMLNNQNFMQNYRHFSLNLCSELFDLIDELKKITEKPVAEANINEMKDYLKEVYLDIYNLTKI
jgi:hypothetical protein